MNGQDDFDESPSGERPVLPVGTQLKQDLAYGKDSSQRLDAYLPPAPADSPILFFVHGGAWQWGNKTGRLKNKLDYFLAKGYIVVSVEYRLSPPDPVAQVSDVAAALAYTQSEAPSWGGNPNKVLVMGHSAGAHLVALLASDPAIATAVGAKPWLGTVALDSAAYDVADIMNHRHFRFYDKVFGTDPNYWQKTSPLFRLNGTPAPFLAICSDERRISCFQAEKFVTKVKSLGGRAEHAPISKSHREINEDLGLPGSYTDLVAKFMRSLGLP